VVERESSAAILVDKREGRAAHFFRIDTQPLGQAANERRLPRAEIS
jgi:hypothetical protein